MMSSSEKEPEPSFVTRLSTSVSRKLFGYLDRVTIYTKTRWFVFLFLGAGLVARVLTYQGFFVILYAWAIYLLNLLIGFLSPQIDTETELYVLPVRDNEEYRPFQRRIPEFQFWFSATRATLFALTLMLFPALDLPVFWPILLIYFLLLFVMTIKQQVMHMMKYNYVPFNWGKQTYGKITRDSSGKSSSSGKEKPPSRGGHRD